MTKIIQKIRSRLTIYRELIHSLGFLGWLRLKVHRVRLRHAKPGAELRISTSLALHPLIVRAGTSDDDVYGQIFLQREYRCLDHVAEAGLIIDCGANVGYSSAYLMSRFPNARVVAIEPEPENFRILTENLAPYGERCTVINGGVWSSSVGLVLSDQELGDRQEWAVTVRPANRYEEPSVVAVDIGAVLAGVPEFDRISILKIDIEGSESEVFSKNTEPWIDKFDHLVIEIHGESCREVVMAATEQLACDISKCEELTVFSTR